MVAARGLALAVPSLSAATRRKAKAATDEDSAAPRRRCRRKIRRSSRSTTSSATEIKKVKYPAAKANIVSHVKGIKADDKKWFEETLPDKTYGSADDVFSALGWEPTPAAK